MKKVKVITAAINSSNRNWFRTKKKNQTKKNPTKTSKKKKKLQQKQAKKDPRTKK